MPKSQDTPYSATACINCGRRTHQLARLVVLLVSIAKQLRGEERTVASDRVWLQEGACFSVSIQPSGEEGKSTPTIAHKLQPWRIRYSYCARAAQEHACCFCRQQPERTCINYTHRGVPVRTKAPLCASRPRTNLC